MLMFQPYAYPPESRASGRDCFGRPLPPLPRKTPRRPHLQYAVNKSFSLKRPNQVVTVIIIKQVDVGYSKYSQAVLANVNDGPPGLAGEQVFLKFYDPLFLNPDDLRSITVPTSPIAPGEGNSSEKILSLPRPSSSSSSHSDILASTGQTLSASVEPSNRDIPKQGTRGILEVNSIIHVS